MPRESLLQRSLRRSGVLDWVRARIERYNRLRESEPYEPPTDCREFRDVQRRSRKPTDISDHLERLFVEALQTDPDTIVECGVRGGESTFVFERVARLADADLVSVDIEDTAYETDYDDWRFVQSDDIEFAGEFEGWCDDRDIDAAIDVLFIDTSHRYEHTLAEIDAWFPHLAEDAVVLFHDTNMQRLYRREEGTIGLSPLTGRGVIRAIEEHFDCDLDETQSFVTVLDGFVLKQYPLCSGLAVLRKLDSETGA
jgi:cephalosporin hydroxylase